MEKLTWGLTYFDQFIYNSDIMSIIECSIEEILQEKPLSNFLLVELLNNMDIHFPSSGVVYH